MLACALLSDLLNASYDPLVAGFFLHQVVQVYVVKVVVDGFVEVFPHGKGFALCGSFAGFGVFA